MTELRDDQQRFVSEAEEHAHMNNLFKSMVGMQPTSTLEPTPAPPANGAGQPVPPGACPEPLDEHKIMNRALLIMAGGIPIDSR